MITADIAVRGFVFALTTLALTTLAALPIVGVTLVVHRRTSGRLAFWVTLAGVLVYTAAVSVGLTVLLIGSGFAGWVGP